MQMILNKLPALWQAKWIDPELPHHRELRQPASVLRRRFTAERTENALLYITCHGLYEARLNGQRVGNFILAPGWTEYRKRLQVQAYDIRDLLARENTLEITVANGWYRRTNAPWTGTQNPDEFLPAMLIAALRVVTEDGEETVILTDEAWEVSESTVTLSGIFIGVDVDMTRMPAFRPAQVCGVPARAGLRLSEIHAHSPGRTGGS